MSIQAEGTTAALTLNTPTSLGGAITTAGVYQLHLSCANMSYGDKLTIRKKTKTRSASSVVSQESYVDHVQDAEIVTPIEVVGYSLEWELEQTAGTGRAFEWRIDKL